MVRAGTRSGQSVARRQRVGSLPASNAGPDAVPAVHAQVPVPDHPDRALHRGGLRRRRGRQRRRRADKPRGAVGDGLWRR